MTAALAKALDGAFHALEDGLARHRPRLEARETGRVIRVGEGFALVDGLPGVGLEELVEIGENTLGLAFDLRPREVGVVLLDAAEGVEAGQEVRRAGRVLDVAVGEALLGRVVDALGRPLDERGPIRAAGRRPLECEAPAIVERAPVEVPLATGVKVIDALLPIGRGQRELIVGDRQTGKTAIALDAVLNQRGRGVPCVYCAIGQRSSAIARLVAELAQRGALAHTVVVVAGGDDPPGLQYAAPYAATTIAEYFMARGRDVLVVYDDLTRHARAYRELSLLLRRPPGREAYPGDVFYIHARLLERATHLRAGGSITALPIVETQVQNLAAYIPTNLISITDGQIVLSPDLFSKGILPAVDIGRSVSRVGARAQLPAYREVAGRLRLAYAQFEELEEFARFETRLDAETRRLLAHGRRIREVLKQPEGEPMPVAEQIAVLLAATEDLFDHLPLPEVAAAACRLAAEVTAELRPLAAAIADGAALAGEARPELLAAARRSLGRG